MSDLLAGSFLIHAFEPTGQITWRPMASAPRDGRHIVVKRPGFDGFSFVSWDAGQWMSGAGPVKPDGLVWRPLEDAIVVEDDDAA